VGSQHRRKVVAGVGATDEAGSRAGSRAHLVGDADVDTDDSSMKAGVKARPVEHGGGRIVGGVGSAEGESRNAEGGNGCEQHFLHGIALVICAGTLAPSTSAAVAA